MRPLTGKWAVYAEHLERVRKVRDAAPELLDALQNCVEHMVWSTPQGEAAYKACKAAIAKATGGAE